jgi:hypothetical protein
MWHYEVPLPVGDAAVTHAILRVKGVGSVCADRRFHQCGELWGRAAGLGRSPGWHQHRYILAQGHGAPEPTALPTEPPHRYMTAAPVRYIHSRVRATSIRHDVVMRHSISDQIYILCDRDGPS